MISTIKVIKYKEPYYLRWMNFNSRCTNTNNVEYPAYGAKGIRVDYCWAYANPEGYNNFKIWILAELDKHPELLKKKFKVGRKIISKNYSPDNCHITTNAVACQNKCTHVLTFEKVVEIRQFRKKNPYVTLQYIATKFDISLQNISRCLRGITWANVNEVESPIKRYG